LGLKIKTLANFVENTQKRRICQKTTKYYLEQKKQTAQTAGSFLTLSSVRLFKISLSI
jgi:hypothetical protein